MQKFFSQKWLIPLLVMSFPFSSGAQCVSISCPSNVIVNNAPGQCGAVVNYTAPVGTTSCVNTATFSYTGGTQTWTVPAGVTSVNIDLKAAGGGTSGNFGTSQAGVHIPGTGGRLQGTLAVTPGQVLNINIGGRGNNGINGIGGTGGFNGGGNGAAGFGQYAGGGGGGASDIRIGGVALANRVAIAGGGGGAGLNTFAGGDNGGHGGGLSGNNGLSADGSSTGGGAGTQGAGGAGGVFLSGGYTSGTAGSLGIGGNGGSGTSGAGGGGGYYGGGGGCWSGGGGGSGFTTGLVTGIVYTSGGGSVNNGDLVISYPQTVTTTQTAGLASGATFPVGVTTNTYSVTNGTNTTTCSFTVTVVDNQSPAITCPANIVVNNTPGACGAAVTYVTPVGTDNCPGVITTQTAGFGSGATFPLGVTTNTFSTTDNVGLTTTCSSTVTVVDAQAPSITCPGNITVNNDPGICGAVVTFLPPIGTDNCLGAATSQISGGQSGNVFPIGASTVSFQVVDNVGLTASCSFNITVADDQDPVIACPGNVNVCDPVVTAIGPGNSSDNCSVSGITYSTTGTTNLSGSNDISGSTFNVGVTTVTYTATDANGNTGTCSFNVDIIAPTNQLATTSSNTVNITGAEDVVNNDCDLIASITPSGVAPLAGNTNFSVTIDPVVNNFGGQLYLQRHYDIEPTTNAANATATVTLYALQSEFDAFNTAAAGTGDYLMPTGGVDNGRIRITQYHGTGTAPGNYTGSVLAFSPSVVWNATDNRWELTFPVTGFSGFYIHTALGDFPLAITLSDIKANNVGHRNQVMWSTASEERGDKFGLEHSTDGVSFKEIYVTPAKGEASQYTYWHEQPATGKNYYRLRLYNAGSDTKFSNVVSAIVKAKNDLVIETYPNPVQNTLSVKVSGHTDGAAQVILTDIAGKVIATRMMNSNITTFDMAGYASGIYFIKYSDVSHNEVIKVNKQ